MISILKFIFSTFSPLNKNCFKLCKFNYNNNDSLLIEKKYNTFYYKKKILKLYPIIIFNDFKIGSQKIKRFNSICFFFNNKYLILPKNNNIYKIYEINNNDGKFIINKIQNNLLLNNIYNRVIICKLKIELRGTNSDSKITNKKRNREKK